MLADDSAHGALPAYVQISEMIARDIEAGHLLVGDRLPPERAMAADIGVAVGTLRKALALLVTRGLIERRQGSGNYIRHVDGADSIYAFFRLELKGGGGLPTAQTLSVAHMDKPDDLPAFGTSTRAFRFRRLRLLGNIPAALEEIWLDGACADRIDTSEVSESLYHFYKSKLGLWIARAEDSISAAPVPGWTVDQFSPKAGDVVGFVERIAWDQHANPVEYSRNWFDPDVAAYVSRLK
ncbi:GntR family transcriptional regulator [Amylibacter marinus]|uniref:GntR family transcriptional regulator n=1 Tax=Amylibacter marinus TaxID=1475483 RepID=A0ABQ5VYK7_9RHOB|nr:GntR family transcriptional regulator [Amylibacter marinus]GLQ36336.1 GntR family transcriptional regulator [Amylibacter marinus]